MRGRVELEWLELEGAPRLRWDRETWFRKRQPRRAPREWERHLLRLIAEQATIPVDQLSRFLFCEVERAEAVVEHLTEVGYVDYQRVVRTESPWVWLTKRGAYFSGKGLRSEQPRVGALERIRAVNEVRLWLEEGEPELSWVSGREVSRRFGRGGARVSGVVQLGGCRHAVKVELVRGDLKRKRAGVEGLLGRYDVVALFCAPGVLGAFRELGASVDAERVVVRTLPEA